MRNHINGNRPTGMELFEKFENNKLSRIYVHGKPELIRKLDGRLGGLGVATRIEKDGWTSIDFKAVDSDRIRFSVATIVTLDEFSGLEIATNEIKN